MKARQPNRPPQAILEIGEAVAAPTLVDSIRDPIQQLATASGAVLSFVIGLVGATWTASGYVSAFAKAMNRIYEVDEGRPFWKLRPIMLLVTVLLLLIGGIMAVLVVASGPVADAIGLRPATVFLWSIFKWPVLLGFAIVLIAVLYYATPNVRHPRFRWMSIGGIIVLLLWLWIANIALLFGADHCSDAVKDEGDADRFRPASPSGSAL